jgi:hypothetical protein
LTGACRDIEAAGEEMVEAEQRVMNKNQDLLFSIYHSALRTLRFALYNG